MEIVSEHDLSDLRDAGWDLHALVNSQTEGHNCEVAAKRNHRPLESWCSLCSALIAWERAVRCIDGTEGA